MNRSRLFALVLITSAASVALSAPAYADESWGEGVEVLQDAEMQDLRGGLAVGGITFDFGAVVTTLVNGMPVVTTQLTITDAGTIVDQTIANVGENIQDMTEDQRNALGLGGLDNAAGVVIQDESGVTALVHNVTNGALQNIIVNTATGRDLAQNIDVTLDLPGFEAIQNSLTTELFAMRTIADLSDFLN